jgi:hypothetical protein
MVIVRSRSAMTAALPSGMSSAGLIGAKLLGGAAVPSLEVGGASDLTRRG